MKLGGTHISSLSVTTEIGTELKFRVAVLDGYTSHVLDQFY
jgi:hypothetical protein